MVLSVCGLDASLVYGLWVSMGPFDEYYGYGYPRFLFLFSSFNPQPEQPWSVEWDGATHRSPQHHTAQHPLLKWC